MGKKPKKLGKLFWVIKWDNKRITNRVRFERLQIGTRGVTNRGSFRDLKSGQVFG